MSSDIYSSNREIIFFKKTNADIMMVSCSQKSWCICCDEEIESGLFES